MTEQKMNESITEYRINRLEEIVEKLAEAQLTLTRIESMGIENQKSIEKVSINQLEQSKIVSSLENKVNKLESKLDIATWLGRLIGGAIVLALIGTWLTGIGLSAS